MAINYTESDYTKKRREYLEGLDSSKPTSYQSQYSQAAKDSIDTLLNRKAFQYDVNEDGLYQQMKDNYIRQGKLAMQDTMGQAAAMTGGYGNSYAQNAGQQAYQGYLQQINDNLPEYYQLAQNAYDAEGDRLKTQYALLSEQENQDYDRYMDSWSRWQQEYQNAQSTYESGRDWDYGLAQDNAALAQAQVNYLLTQGVTPNAELLAAAGYDDQYINQMVKQYTPVASSGASSGTSYKKKTTDEDSETDSNVESNSNAYANIGWADVVDGAVKTYNSGGDVNAYINAAKKEGIITQNQAKDLRINIKNLSK